MMPRPPRPETGTGSGGAKEIIKEFKEWGTLELTGFCKHLASGNERYIAAGERKGKWNCKDI